MEILSASVGTDGGTALSWACVLVSVVCLALLGRYLQLYTRHVALLARAVDLTEREPLIEAHVRRVLDEVTRPAPVRPPETRLVSRRDQSRRECVPAHVPPETVQLAGLETTLAELRAQGWAPHSAARPEAPTGWAPLDEATSPDEAVLARWETRRQAALARANEYGRTRREGPRR
jgi:hypothetical protein